MFFNRKYLFLILAFIFTIVGFNVNAETYNGRLYEVFHPNSGFNVFASESKKGLDYNSWVIKSSIDDKIYYCIDPTISLEGSLEGSHEYINNKYKIFESTNITEDQYERVKLLAFYGYMYKHKGIDHTDKKWYGITQVLIWRTMRPDLNWTFKADRNSKPNASLYSSELKEINNLISNHYKLASFAEDTFKVLLGDTITLKDSNNILSKFNISNRIDNSLISINNNSLIITGKKTGKKSLYFSRENKSFPAFGVLVGNSLQDVVVSGSVDVAHFKIDIDVVGGTLNVIKNDYDNKNSTPSGEASLEGTLFGIYDENDKLVKKVSTDSNGKISVILDYGKYYLKEEKAPTGYLIDETKHEFEISKDIKEVNLNIYDKVIKGKLVINKTRGGSGEEYVPEEGAVFDVYDKNDKKILQLVTDDKGSTSATIPYGSYKIKQIKGMEGYVISSDFDLNITKDKEYVFNIKNKKLSKLELTKIDYNTKKKISGTLFEIYNSYDQKVFEGVTDDNGKLVLEGLPIGRYYVLEKEASKYYIKSLEKSYFEVSNDGKVIKLSISNKRKTGSLIISKIDGITKRGLSDSIIRIVDSSNKKVFEGRTSKDGKISLDNFRNDYYCIYEDKAPSGYKKLDKPKCVDFNSDSLEVVISNDKVVSVPNTFKNDNYIAILIGTILIVFSSCAIIYVKNK